MSLKKLLLFGAALFAICSLLVILLGQRYTVKLTEADLQDPLPDDAGSVEVRIDGADPAAEITGFEIKDGALLIGFSPLRRGKTDVGVYYGGKTQFLFRIVTGPLGVLTYDTPFGDSTGDIAVPVSSILFLLAALYHEIGKLRREIKESLYRYSNVMRTGLIVFLCFFILTTARQCFGYRGIVDSASEFLSTVHYFSLIVLPVASLLSVLVALSSISLMRREGRSWRNMLGVILGAALCLLTLLPGALGEYLQWSPNAILDVHNERGAGLYIELLTEGVISMFVTYLECILIGTVIFGIAAARHIPAFDKDYIIILGCMIREDGTLTPLLRSRADRALEFARMQKEKTGRDIFFLPSGGRGADEPLSEAEAIGRYLSQEGVPEDRILPETRSTDTRENMLFSSELIKEHSGGKEVKIAFSTTNYHVFRAGLTADRLGLSAEGIGSPTKRYFWINAFVREFIATMVSERMKHAAVIAAAAAMIIIAVLIKYLSVVL
ncbi:MAG: YdcF family protein [Clostridia bacterium]|nr:YdcF family protein [Clostridia bacterium]